MAKSAKSKRAKKADFTKPKLKLGRPKPKPENYTDVSFSAQRIAVLHQNLSSSAPSQTALFTHHLALLSHKSDAQRAASLAHLTTALSSLGGELPLPGAQVLTKVAPLLLDANGSVRNNTLKFLALLSDAVSAGGISTLLLYIRAALTHLSARVRFSGVDALSWLLRTDKRATRTAAVSSSGGFAGLLEGILGLLGWLVSKPGNSKGWSSSTASGGKAEDEGKGRATQLTALALLLDAGLVDGERESRAQRRKWEMGVRWPLVDWRAHKIGGAGTYDYLNLYGDVGGASDEACPEVADRMRVYARHGGAVRAGLETAKREGGGIGRAAVAVEKVLAGVYLDDDRE
ncbi:hypothetical protein BT63DRAFT_423732 [Microthyrium microscopicum]|uniref:Pre-rRNA-processing protein n=1 Tax=Microthyrium microscopicum TaxID=703497 RepID=A0A6A6UIL2_9PEZI|nr:hypothetical protein BT63DRAFT_423732 [Microthyrium microscopicum]